VPVRDTLSVFCKCVVTALEVAKDVDVTPL
jgi:hypothetical protein